MWSVPTVYNASTRGKCQRKSNFSLASIVTNVIDLSARESAEQRKGCTALQLVVANFITSKHVY